MPNTPLDNLSDEAHVWFVNPESIKNAISLKKCESMLSDVERMQYNRFRFPDDRQCYLAAHALIRGVLSTYIDSPPAAWTFEKNTRGKPEISNPGIPSLRFNLTHTAGLAACVIALDNACGIDAEKLQKRNNLAGVAKRMFSEQEYGHVKDLTGTDQLEYFLEQWTLREAYVKARGIGISFPTRSLQFCDSSEKGINVKFAPDIDDNPSTWQFHIFRPTNSHVAAVALKLQPGTRKRIVARSFEL